MRLLFAKIRFVRNKIRHYKVYNKDYGWSYRRRMANRAWKNNITNLKRLHGEDWLNYL